jgi:thioredoxin 1
MTEITKGPSTLVKALIIVTLAVVVGSVFIAKNSSKSDEGVKPAGSPSKAIPVIVDLGARKCIPCKMMAPILEELKVEYKGQFDVIFIDVWENGAAIDQYGVRIIPTQIFFDSEGEELFRHEGFFSKEDILGKWKEFGMDISTLSET